MIKKVLLRGVFVLFCALYSVTLHSQQIKSTGYSQIQGYKQKAELLKFNVSGEGYLLLETYDSGDGTNYDQSVWLDAKFVMKNGTVRYLDAEPLVYGYSGWGNIIHNANVSNKKLSVNGKEYDRGVWCHANGLLLYKIPEGAVTFESYVGIDDEGITGTVQFRASIANSDFITNHIANINQFKALHGKVADWFLTPEKVAKERGVKRAIEQLNNKDYYLTTYNSLKTNKVSQSEIGPYFNLLSEVLYVKRLQERVALINVEAVKRAFNDMRGMEGYNAVEYEPMVNELVLIANSSFCKIYDGDLSIVKDIERAEQLKRNILLSNPLLDCDKIIAVKYNLGNSARSAMAPQLGTQSNNWSNQESAPRGGFDATIVEMSNLRGDIKFRDIYKPQNGSSVADLRMHWDADRVMFTQTQEDKRWNVFQVNIDGSGFKKMIENPEQDLEFYDGTYLPDGRILAVSNIGYQGVPCVNGTDAVGNMVLYNPKEQSLRRLTFDQDANWNPVVMNNGRVMYTRWEYTDLTHYYSRIVMHMNPDGTENKALYGSGGMFPNSTFDIQPLPNHSSAFIGVISGHHGTARSGRLILFDPTKGRKSVAGMVQEIPYSGRQVEEVIKDSLVERVWPQFVKPSVLNDKYFLVAAKMNPQSLWGVYLVDIFDNMTCLYEMEGEGYISPILLKKSKTPPAIPDRVKLNEKEATFFIQDIYEGEGLRGIPRGTVKELRLHAYEYAYVNTASDHNWHGIQSGWDIKRILGTVPVEEDGSVIFKAPANTPISIQPLDKDGVAIQWMRSWVVGQPGEIVSCVGCHEDQNTIAIPKRVMASQREPHKLTPPEGGVRSFTFDMEIQPILDRACIACHNGQGRAFDLRGGTKDELGYGTSYLNFHPYIHRQGGEGDMVVLPPYEYHPNTSELVRILKNGHYNVELTDKEWRTLYNWIDYNCPDKGYFLANTLNYLPYKGYDQYERRIELTNKYGNGAGVDWKKEIEDYAAYLKEQGPIKAVMPETAKENSAKSVKAKGWPFSADIAKSMQAECGDTEKIVELAPGISMRFVKIPAGEFVMGSNLGESVAKPESKVKITKPFWMGELEVTNEQFRVIFPEHDSRYIDQQWKDHVVQGYHANGSDQPVIRVSYNKIMEYCQKLSEKTGLNITLPTEAQWEWACRAGSDSDFWFGDLHTDYGKMENLADKTTLEFAVVGVDPKPMATWDFWYKYYTYLPKDVDVNDGNLIQIGGKSYQANPFGLYNMHGNVAEWTRSDYHQYPYKESYKDQSECKVVRGGSFFERAKFSTSHTRKGYLPYQSIFNVGFRLIIEE